MTQENLERNIKDSEIIEILGSQQMASRQVLDAYTEEYEFVGMKKIMDKLREMAESDKLEEEPMRDAQDLMYAVKEA